MGMQVAANGRSIQTATGPQQLLNDKMPLTKLDTTKNESFQTISVLFNHEPPQPDPVTGIGEAQLYQFKHTYTYVPRIWMEWQNPSPAYPAPPGAGGNTTTFFTFGDDTANNNIVGSSTALAIFASAKYNADPTYGTNSTNGFVYAKVDMVNVTLYFRKQGAHTTFAPLFVIGETVNIRLYVFAEPATTSTY